jgi:hypothetical protein
MLCAASRLPVFLRFFAIRSWLPIKLDMSLMAVERWVLCQYARVGTLLFKSARGLFTLAFIKACHINKREGRRHFHFLFNSGDVVL